MKLETIVHDIPPLYDAESRVLLLGSLPSPKSREAHFFYGHPRNRFWKVIAELCNEPAPESIADKKILLHRHHIALWDVIAECDIKGSSDSSIRNVIPNDIPKIIARSSITAVYANGRKAYDLYQKYVYDNTGLSIALLPSTSPANAACSFTQLLNTWNRILN